MHDFNYHCPDSLAAALALLKDDDARALAGGMTLLPAMKMRLASPSALVDLCAIDSLAGVRPAGDGIEIGAMTTHAAVAADPLVRERMPALAALAGQIGDAQVRNRGTLGGSVANNDPAADYPAALLALDAVVITTAREIAAVDFFIDMFETALKVGELVTAVRFVRPLRAAYAKFPNPASRYAIAGVMVAELPSGPRVAITGAASVAFRHADMEAALAASFRPAALDGLSVPADQLNSDLHADADYRAHLTQVMARRAVEAAGV